MNWELKRNFVDLNSTIGNRFGVGVTDSISTPLNPSVGGIILADGSSGTCASSSGTNHGGWGKMYSSSCVRPSTCAGSNFLCLFPSISRMIKASVRCLIAFIL
ncbi:hypothetical protein H5410_028710, partial [Solanum commersonii]